MRANSQKTDSQLVSDYISGNRAAVTVLIKRWHGRFCDQAYWYVKDRDAAKDVAQESWTIILNKVHSLQDRSKFGAWALRVVTRKAIDVLRKKKLEHQNLREHDNYIDTDYDQSNQDSAAAVVKMKKAIQSLPVGQRMVIRLFYLEGYRIKEIGRVLGISTGTVKSRLFHAREKLKELMKE